MLPLAIQNKLNEIKANCLVTDIECSSHYSDGREIDIKRDFENYVANAIVKWVGFYSFKNKKSYYLNAITQRRQIESLLREHNVIVGFNNTDFDWPIIVNNGLSEHGKRYLQVDLMQILGTASQKSRDGYKFKDRAKLMGHSLKNNSLRCMAETFGLQTQKGEIDYKLFDAAEWSEEETSEIIKYLADDVMATKELFDKAWNFWLPFAEMIDEPFVYDLSWLRSSIASVTYKAATRVLGVEPTYGEQDSVKENMGGNVLLPKYEEARKAWYLDFTSLYPHMYTQFNLNAEVKEEDINKYNNIWHGNELFNVKGYYSIDEWHPLSKYLAEKIKERIELKAKDETDPKVYALKILINSYYGASRSPIFEKIHTPNCGWDCCWLSQQVQAFTIEMMEQFGFEAIAGDTDSALVVALKEEHNNGEYVQGCLNQIIAIIQEHMPFPVDTFQIKIEKYLEYIMFPFTEQPIVDDDIRDQLKNGMVKGYIEKTINKKTCIVDESTGEAVKVGRSWVKKRQALKKNYLYVYDDNGELKVELVGLALKKDTATPLAMQIFKEILEPEIIKQQRAKFPKEYIDNLIKEYLQKPGVLESLATEYKVQKAETYKKDSQIQCQVSQAYFGGEAGVIRLIKNTKVGKAGKGTKYCTVEEAREAKLTVDDLDLEKVNNELDPFVEYREEFWVKSVETGVEYLVTKDAYEAGRDVLERIVNPRKKKQVP